MVTQEVDKSPLGKTGIFTVQSCFYSFVFKCTYFILKRVDLPCPQASLLHPADAFWVTWSERDFSLSFRMRHREYVDREGLERRRTGTKQGVDSDNVNDFVFSLGTVHCTGNLSNICSQIQEVVDEQQKKAVWVPLSSV